MDLPKYIYHYTSNESFLGILNSQTFWLTDIHTMNDRTEMLEMVNRLEEDLLKSGANEKRARALISHSEEDYPYIVRLATCFTTLRDDAAMWERYADNARGVCIKVDTEKLCKWIRKQREEFNKVYELDFINYSGNERYNWILDDIKKEMGKLTESQWESAIRGTLPLYIQRYAVLYKNKGFESEREVRLHTTLNIKDKKPEHFQEIKDVIKCVEKLEINVDDLFSEVILGPRTQQNKEILAYYLRSHNHIGVAENITSSECSLR